MSRRWRAAVILMAGVLGAVDAAACMCGWSRAFLTGVRSTSLVFVGTVREYRQRPETMHPYAMAVEVESVLKGEYGAQRITIWGDNGKDCLPYVTAFPLGTRWVFSVSGPTSIANFGDENYHFDFCATNWLALFGGNVDGFIEEGGGAEELTLAELSAMLDGHRAGIKPRKAYASLPPARGHIAAPVPIESVAVELTANCAPPPNGIEVDLVIDSSGNVRHWAIAGGTPACAVAATCTAIQSLRFRPAIVDGKPVSVWHRIGLAVKTIRRSR